MTDFMASARAAFLAATGFFIDGGPGAAFGFLFGGATIFVAFLDVLGLAFLFAGITRLVSTRHDAFLQINTRVVPPVATLCTSLAANYVRHAG
jgi:hypothetical protein